MPEFRVIGIVGASVSQTVEADSAEDALDQAELSASICYHCSREGLEVGDVYDFQVLDADGEVLLPFEEDERRELRNKEAKALTRARDALADILKSAEARNIKWLTKLAKKGLGR